MKKVIALTWAFTAAQLITSCSTNKVQYSRVNMEENSRLLTPGPLWGALYQQHAAEYKALTLQAYNVARERLDKYMQQPGDKPFAVISDIDETIPDNCPSMVHDALLGHTCSDTSWMAWTKREEADTVAGAPAFFKYAASKNVAVFYISNRSLQEQSQTIANLKKYDMPYVDTAHLLLKTITSNKDARRAQVAANYNVLLYFGDNPGDYKGVFDRKSVSGRDSLVYQYAADFGNRFIVLPNPVYGEWVADLYQYRFTECMRAKADSMLKTLRTYWFYS
jgi:5'-nucleotidase (lipoprotein e(P4) family)